MALEALYNYQQWERPRCDVIKQNKLKGTTPKNQTLELPMQNIIVIQEDTHVKFDNSSSSEHPNTFWGEIM